MVLLSQSAAGKMPDSEKMVIATHRPFIIPKTMSDKIFCRFRDYIQTNVGIKMPDVKKTMLQSRLQKRLRALNIETYETYCDYVFSHRGRASELIHMIDAVTTNKTDFFREPQHFTYLLDNVLPTLADGKRPVVKKNIRFWSAGCSTGAEPYTLAMVLCDYVEDHPEFGFNILATDISSRVLEKAAAGIYDEEMMGPIPERMRKKYLLKSKNRSRPMVRMVPSLRSMISFRRLNFMEEHFDIRRPADVVFCRNVLIYFERSTQEMVINRICRYLNDGGYIFIGHSETLNGLNVPLMQVSPTIYRKWD